MSPYAITALNTAPAPDSCAITAQGGSGGSFYINGGGIRSNGGNCLNGTLPTTVTATSDMSSLPGGKNPITGTLGTNIGLTPMTDPYPQITLTTPPTPSYPNCSTSNFAWAGCIVGASMVPSKCYDEVDHYLGLPPNTPPPLSSNGHYNF
jgi:hypothetical protein